MANVLNQTSDAPVHTPLAGTMKGTITRTGTTDKFDFTSTSISRYSRNGRMRVVALMQTPEFDSPVHVEYQLVNDNAPSKTYRVGDPEVEALFINYPGDPYYGFVGISGGQINLQNHTPELRINGVLDFTAQAPGAFQQYDVRMVFEVTGITAVALPGS